MQRYWKSLLAGGIILGSMIGISAASPAAQAGTMSSTTANPKGDYGYTKYLCQKWYNGHWCTVYTTYSYDDAMDWLDGQDKGARVIAQK